MTTTPAPSQPPSPMRILVVDDHAVVREGLKRMLESTEPDWCVLEAADAASALEVVRAEPLDLAIVDIAMPGISGLDLLKRLRTLRPELRVLMLSMYAEQQYAVRAFKSGASGYVTKDSAPRELVHAIHRVTAGGAYVSESLAQSLALGLGKAQSEAAHDQLSNRELEVLRRLAAGERPTEIAHSLHISIKTVSTHKARVLARLGLPNTAALIRYAIEHQLVPEPVAPAPDRAR
ncbi:MAG TPA: response regulator transcription factor [Burkholderiaceae bacterium]